MTLRSSLCVVALCAPCSLVIAQQAAPATQGRTGAVLQPTVQLVKEALSTITVDKWKAAAAIKSEADSNLRSVQRDIDTTLPALVVAADAAPGSTSKALPVFRNVDALYDVMLRLDAAGRLAASKDEIGALDDSLASIATARRSLGDQLQADAEAQEQRVGTLQQQLAAKPAAPPPAPAVACLPPPPAASTKKKAPTVKKAPATTVAH